MKIFRRKNFESEMEAELRAHIEAYTADLVRSGLSPDEAARRARVEFGPVEAAKDRCRESWGLQRLDDLRADLRLTWRALRRNPGFAAVAILSLALGIGANTAIFGLVDAVMLRLLWAAGADDLVVVGAQRAAAERLDSEQGPDGYRSAFVHRSIPLEREPGLGIAGVFRYIRNSGAQRTHVHGARRFNRAEGRDPQPNGGPQPLRGREPGE
jgi:hypothetical protein